LNVSDVLSSVIVGRRCWIVKSSADEVMTDPHPVSPKSLVSDVDDEMYLRPSNGCHGDGASSSSSSPPGYVAPDAPPRSPPSGRQGDGHHDNEVAAAAAATTSRCSECCCCCNADVCPPPPTTKDAPIAGPSTLGPPSRTGRLRQAAASTATGGGGPAYRRAASCIEQNKYTHIWQMPLPTPGE